ncbi:Hypothetical protein DIP1940 [Corynebacterium diphtheriae]|uniref:Uncharacterized protein n=1 Tax=Corynebacterium diphtheriae (strain ATCC 700971 / NCTC 13129 / Biotype gravis) TaxID=257309 RepID=Q6NFF1_CORDI|nr:Hypothetical protein DIP1940 [Corynebacterium diphtheriae]
MGLTMCAKATASATNGSARYLVGVPRQPAPPKKNIVLVALLNTLPLKL